MEKPSIKIQTTVNLPITSTWNIWTNPEHIMNWNFAGDDWHCPAASIDLRVGGKFSYTMAAKDGSFAFDFSGTYTDVIENKYIEIILDDNRRVWLEFSENGNETTIIEKFEAESENTLELQEMGWQMILNNFKKYAESCN